MPSAPVRAVLAGTVVATLATLLAAAPSPAHAPAAGPAGEVRPPAATAPAPGTVTIAGRGFGHGRGMSQWGAEGAAVAGLTSSQILDFYYPGTSPARHTGAVRVWITGDTSPDLVVDPAPGLAVRDLADGTRWELPTTLGATAWRLRYGPDDRVLVEYRTPAGWVTWPVPGRGALTGAGELAAHTPLTLVTPAGEVTYRGRLRTANRAGADMDTLNVVAADKYVRGVVAAESPAYWKPAALEAQAVAARTYAAYQAGRAQQLGRDYDLCDTPACQVYRGVAGEEDSTDAAVAATRGQIRTFGGSPILAEFSSSNGGQRVGTTVPYQQFGDDPYDTWSGNPMRSWTVQVPAADLVAAWPALGQLRTVQVTGRDGHGTWGGRVTRVQLVGTKTTVNLTGDDLRIRLGLRSTLYTLTGPA